MASHGKSKIWQHFIRKTKEESECKVCHKLIKCSGGSTSSLHKLIKSIHSIDLESGPSDEDHSTKKQKTLEYFIQKRFIEEDVSRMASVDGMSYHCIANSKFIQESFQKFIYDKCYPKNHITVSNLVLNFYDKKKQELAQYFKDQVKKNVRFSITFD